MTDDERDRLLPACAAASLLVPVLGTLMAMLPALVTGAMGGAMIGIIFFIFATVVAAGHVLFLGLPLFAALSARGPAGWPAACAAGFALGALPVQLLIDPGDSSRIVFGIVFGLCGLSSALAFWRVLYRR